MSKPYRKRYGSYDSRGRIRNRKSIDERPAIVDQKKRLGDWEGDTTIGKARKGALLTMVERKSLYVVIGRLEGKNASALADELIASLDRKSTRLNSSHVAISYAVFCLKKKKEKHEV